MSARDFLEAWAEFDGKPGTSVTDVVATVVVAMMVLSMVGLVVLVLAATV